MQHPGSLIAASSADVSSLRPADPRKRSASKSLEEFAIVVVRAYVTLDADTSR